MQFLLPKDYQAACQAKFECYKVDILQLLPAAIVEHIGASSIPGAISKGDLDIYIGITQAQHAQAITILKTLNFYEKQNTLRTETLCMLESNNKDDVAFQVVAIGSHFEMFLHFRDALRAAPELVRDYNALKARCAGMAPDEYWAQKSKFITHVLQDFETTCCEDVSV